MFYGMNTPHKVVPSVFHHFFNAIFDNNPQTYRLKCLGRELKWENTNQFLPGGPPFLIPGYCFCHGKIAEFNNKLPFWLAPGNLDNLGFFFRSYSSKIFQFCLLSNNVFFLDD